MLEFLTIYYFVYPFLNVSLIYVVIILFYIFRLVIFMKLLDLMLVFLLSMLVWILLVVCGRIVFQELDVQSWYANNMFIILLLPVAWSYPALCTKSNSVFKWIIYLFKVALIIPKKMSSYPDSWELLSSNPHSLTHLSWDFHAVHFGKHIYVYIQSNENDLPQNSLISICTAPHETNL